MKNLRIGTNKIAGFAAVAFGVLTAGVTPANAAVVFVFQGTTPGLTAGTTNFLYDINFQTNTSSGSITPNDRFVGDGTTYGTLYDVQGFLGAVLNPVTTPFSVTSQLVGKTPIGIAPTDSTTITNVTLTYTGPTLTTDISFPQALVISTSVSGLNVNGQYSGQDIKNAGGAAGSPATNFGFVTVPTTSTTTPEPASMFLLGAGLIGIGAASRKKFSLRG